MTPNTEFASSFGELSHSLDPDQPVDFLDNGRVSGQHFIFAIND